MGDIGPHMDDQVGHLAEAFEVISGEPQQRLDQVALVFMNLCVLDAQRTVSVIA